MTCTIAFAALLLQCLEVAPPAGQRARAPELERLSMLVGVFEGEVRIEPAGGQLITGRMQFSAQWDLDSSWVVARYTQSMRGVATSGLLMYSWDARTRKYLFYGFPNSAMEPNRLSGTFLDATLTFMSDSTGQSGYRESWRLAGSDTLHTELSGFRGGRWISGPRTTLIRIRPR